MHEILASAKICSGFLESKLRSECAASEISFVLFSAPIVMNSRESFIVFRFCSKEELSFFEKRMIISFLPTAARLNANCGAVLLSVESFLEEGPLSKLPARSVIKQF